MTVEPLAGAIAHPDEPLHVVGNVYLLDATYRPSGDEAKLANLATVVLVYPLLANDHGSHSIIWSTTGDRWKALRRTTCRASSRPGADIHELGYVSVAGAASLADHRDGSSGGGSSAATIAIVAGLVVLAIVAAVLLRRGSRSDVG